VAGIIVSCGPFLLMRLIEIGEQRGDWGIEIRVCRLCGVAAAVVGGCRGLQVVPLLLASAELHEEGVAIEDRRYHTGLTPWRTSRRSSATAIRRGRHLGGSRGAVRTQEGGITRAWIP